MAKVYVVYVSVLLCGLAAARRAPFIKPCKAEDTVCLKESAEKALPIMAAGIPEYNITVMDPMFMEQVKTKQAGLEMDFRNTTVTGLKNCKVLSLKRAGLRTYLDLKCSVDMVGDYTLGGQLLIMPIEGNGKYTIKIRDILVKILFHVDEKEVNGEKYWVVKSWKHSTDVQKSAHFHFTNLFNGNKQLAQAVSQFANDNWREIFQEVAPPIVKAIVAEILQQVMKLFDSIPYTEFVVK